eukprot:TRINITY_DN3051_c0_g1_i1.p1 TRINITY_DN3051_c0_g1~~TRINITY_DN3051_c0_g1_i1.p1  ORF type:complete len:609 (+),score=105.11 TRINITY_DN3051_c0_g1_i1:52-1878(+)
MSRRHRSIKRRCALFSASITLTVVYLLIGAVAMRALERPTEDEQFDEQYKEFQLLELSEFHLNKLEELGMCTFPNHKTRHWTFTGACFFSLTVITTIGYGSFAPLTQRGRSFTTFFAIFGIGIVGQLLAQCAALIHGIFKGCIERCEGKGRYEEPPVTTAQERTGRWAEVYGNLTGDADDLEADELASFISELTGCDTPDPTILAHILNEVDPECTGMIPVAQLPRAVHIWYEVQMDLPRGITRVQLAVSVGAAGVWCVVWAGVFSFIEGWTFREGLWFCFVTMSTIGFGDYTPDTHLGRMMAFLFIVPGLGLGAGALGALWEAFVDWRFWWLQRAHRRGKVSVKMLEAHGITCVIDPRRENASAQPKGSKVHSQLRRPGKRAPGDGLITFGGSAARDIPFRPGWRKGRNRKASDEDSEDGSPSKRKGVWRKRRPTRVGIEREVGTSGRRRQLPPRPASRPARGVTPWIPEPSRAEDMQRTISSPVGSPTETPADVPHMARSRILSPASSPSVFDESMSLMQHHMDVSVRERAKEGVLPSLAESFSDPKRVRVSVPDATGFPALRPNEDHPPSPSSASGRKRHRARSVMNGSSVVSPGGGRGRLMQHP